MDCAARGMFVFTADLSPHAQQNEKFGLSPIRSDLKEVAKPVRKYCGARIIKILVSYLFNPPTYPGYQIFSEPYTIW